MCEGFRFTALGVGFWIVIFGIGPRCSQVGTRSQGYQNEDPNGWVPHFQEPISRAYIKLTSRQLLKPLPPWATWKDPASCPVHRLRKPFSQSQHVSGQPQPQHNFAFPVDTTCFLPVSQGSAVALSKTLSCLSRLFARACAWAAMEMLLPYWQKFKLHASRT